MGELVAVGHSQLNAEAVGLMNKAKITCLFVTDADGNGGEPQIPIGILHMHDCLKAGIV